MPVNSLLSEILVRVKWPAGRMIQQALVQHSTFDS